MSLKIQVGKNGIGQMQMSIGDGNGGYRIAGGKYDGMGKTLMEHTLTLRDAEEIRRYLDKAFPPATTEPGHESKGGK